MTNDSEFDDDSGIIPDDDMNDGMPEVETAEEYGYVEPSTDVPPPDDDVPDQNPGFTEGAHT